MFRKSFLEVNSIVGNSPEFLYTTIGDIVLQQNFCFFTSNFLHFLHQKFCFFTPKFLFFLHQNFAFLHQKVCFFTPKFLLFYTKNFAMLNQIFCFFTPKCFLFYTKIFHFLHKFFTLQFLLFIYIFKTEESTIIPAGVYAWRKISRYNSTLRYYNFCLESHFRG